MELTTVSEDAAVLHDGAEVIRIHGLSPDTAYSHDGLAFRTLPRPGGERLATVATVNDLHLGEVECGRYVGVDLGPVIRCEPGEPSYPETMSRAAAAEIAAVRPDAVVAKGDLTAHGAAAEIAAFQACWRVAFGDSLHAVNGNHDVSSGALGLDAPTVAEVELPGVRLAVLDTSVPGACGGALDAGQLEWLDELGARSDRPVLVFGHHPLADGGAPVPGLDPEGSDRLVAVFARRPALAGYFAGHTHRNHVRRAAATGDVPWAEVSSTKDFPGAWAEYRVYEGGILQIVHRISSPEALSWTDRTRAMFAGLYPSYAFGELADRCFPVVLSAP